MFILCYRVTVGPGLTTEEAVTAVAGKLMEVDPDSSEDDVEEEEEEETEEDARARRESRRTKRSLSIDSTSFFTMLDKENNEFRGPKLITFDG